MSEQEQPGRDGSRVERGVRPDPERAAFERWCRENGHGELDDMMAPLDRSLKAMLLMAFRGGSAWRCEHDSPSDKIIELAEALQVRRILEEVKKVAAIYPAADMPTPFQSAWQQCCEEIFYRATGEQWHMDEDADRFARRRAANEPRA